MWKVTDNIRHAFYTVFYQNGQNAFQAVWRLRAFGLNRLSYHNCFQYNMWVARLSLSVNGFSSRGHILTASQQHLILWRDDDHSDLLMFFGLMHLKLHHKVHCNSSDFFPMSLNILFVLSKCQSYWKSRQFSLNWMLLLLSSLLSRAIEEMFFWMVDKNTYFFASYIIIAWYFYINFMTESWRIILKLFHYHSRYSWKNERQTIMDKWAIDVEEPESYFRLYLTWNCMNY